MTVKGRTTPRWGRDRSARWDPGATNMTRFYPARPQPKLPDASEAKEATLPGRRGAAERELTLCYHAKSGFVALDITTHGWYLAMVNLDERQARFLRDTLNEWFPD